MPASALQDVRNQVLERNRLAEFEQQTIAGPQPVLTTPGIDVTKQYDDVIGIQRTPELQGILSGIGGAYTTQADRLAGMLPQVEPGIGKLTQSSLAALENRRRKSIGDLRSNLARRRMAGSSFASDAIARADAEFGQKESQIRSTSFLAELEAKTQLIQQEAVARSKSFAAHLAQTKFEATLGAGLSTGIANLVQQNAQFEAELASQQGGGFDLLSGIAGGFTGYVTSGGNWGAAGAGFLEGSQQ